MSSDSNKHSYAAVDLGSNSFHLLVAHCDHGELRTQDRIKEMVRLGGGLDADGNLDREVQDRAFACLARFGQRIRGIPQENLRAVGTQTLRRMKQANAFLMIAETALGTNIDIIAGREEARLIYIGVTQGVPGQDENRLVIDIGGGSTELVIGCGLEPLETESLQYGCVSLTRRFFGDGRISRGRWEKAVNSAMADLQELRLRYQATGWQTVIGSSGTIKAVEEICRRLGWREKDISADALHMLRDRILEFETIDSVRLPGLSERRHPVLIGGMAMLFACFQVLGINTMTVSPYALREGVLHDLLGRTEQKDPRDKTVEAFMQRYSVDVDQVERVRRIALTAYDKIADSLYARPVHRRLLDWAARLHEAGLSVSHSLYHRHSGYLVEHSDMAGFTRQEQLFLASLVRCHRRAIPGDYGDALPTRLHEPLRMTLMCLRLASILCRGRDDASLPEFRLSASENTIQAGFSPEWMEAHPLTLFDLKQESRELKTLGLRLRVMPSPGS
ncbi:MAG: Ppx/GppA phosphatase family protein [Lysobacterales bacterium]|jgi:exopolyphosphatase/guanosine-5'-triphosphate,3'-diphosphate pyrophosphatase